MIYHLVAICIQCMCITTTVVISTFSVSVVRMAPASHVYPNEQYSGPDVDVQEIYWGTVFRMPAPGTYVLRSTDASDEVLYGPNDLVGDRPRQASYWHHFRVTFHPNFPGSQLLGDVSIFKEGVLELGAVHVCHKDRIAHCTDFDKYLQGLLIDGIYHAWAITSAQQVVWQSTLPCTNLYVQHPDVAALKGWDYYQWYELRDIGDVHNWHESRWYGYMGYQRLVNLCGRPIVSNAHAAMLDVAADEGISVDAAAPVTGTVQYEEAATAQNAEQ